MGKGQPYILGSRMYLLYTITEKLRLIQMPTYAYDSSTDLSNDGGGMEVDDEDDTSMAALATAGAVLSPAPMGNWMWLELWGSVWWERARRDS
jgi:hypothetical protein